MCWFHGKKRALLGDVQGTMMGKAGDFLGGVGIGGVPPLDSHDVFSACVSPFPVWCVFWLLQKTRWG